MLHLSFKVFKNEFQYPFQTFKGKKTENASLVISLSMQGQYGLGEVTEITYYNETIDKMVRLLTKHKNSIEHYSLISPERFWHFLHHLIPESNFLIAALDMAAWDLWGKLHNKPTRNFFTSQQSKSSFATSYTIGSFDPVTIKNIIQEQDYPIYKIKLGGEHDVACIEAIASNSDALIRIDVNEGWTLHQANNILPLLKESNVELIEQPFSRDDLGSLIEFKKECSIPIIADEAFTQMNQIDHLKEYYDGFNIKLSKLGGLTPAYNCITKILSFNKSVMLGCMGESNIGIAAANQLSAFSVYNDLDGPLLLKTNIGKGLEYKKEQLLQTLTNGNGVIF